MRFNTDLTADYLRSRVSYDVDTGLFTWLAHPGKANGHRAWDKQWAGKLVGRSIVANPKNPRKNYAIIRIGGRFYAEHRLAWLYVHGSWPVAEIDHRDGNSLNNHISNLREATHGQNQTNRGAMRNNKLGVKGVTYWAKHDRYVAQIRKNGRTRHIGMYKTLEEAQAAYLKVAAEVHGEFLHHSLKSSEVADSLSP